jgi:hypothetical protein
VFFLTVHTLRVDAFAAMATSSYQEIHDGRLRTAGISAVKRKNEEQNKKPQTQVMSHGTSVDQPSPKCCSKTA